jgi:hypothetical protein
MRADSIENTMKAMMWRQDGLSAIFAKALILRSSSDRRRSQQIELMLGLCTLPAWKYRADMSAKKIPDAAVASGTIVVIGCALRQPWYMKSFWCSCNGLTLSSTI